MNKTTPILVFTFISLFSLGTLAMVSYQPDLTSQLKKSYSSFVETKEETKSAEIPKPLPVEIPEVVELPDLKRKLSKDAYEDHLSAAEFSGIGLIQDENQLKQLVSTKVLVEASEGTGYKVDPLTHSHPFITQHSKKILEEIGKTYQALAGEGNYFTVTSATRTIDQQKKLKRRNRNATDGNSSHSYGVSFDISYIRFNGVKNWDQKAQKKLEAVLSHFQKENKIFVIKERKQSCYHITVR